MESHERLIDSKMELHIVRKLSDRLTDAQKVVFQLYCCKNKPLSRQDIAKLTDSTLSSVDGLLNRAKEKLKEAISEKEKSEIN